MDAKAIISNAKSILSDMDISSSDIRMEEFEQRDDKYLITVSYLMPLSDSGSQNQLVRVYKDLVVNSSDNSVQSVKMHRN